MLGFCALSDVSLIGWLAQNFEHAQTGLLIIGLIGVALLTGGIVWLIRVAYRRLRELEAL